LNKLLEDQRNNENKKLNDWMNKTASARKKLRGFEEAGQTRVSHAKDDLESSILEHEVIMYGPL